MKKHIVSLALHLAFGAFCGTLFFLASSSNDLGWMLVALLGLAFGYPILSGLVAIVQTIVCLATFRGRRSLTPLSLPCGVLGIYVFVLSVYTMFIWTDPVQPPLDSDITIPLALIGLMILWILWIADFFYCLSHRDSKRRSYRRPKYKRRRRHF